MVVVPERLEHQDWCTLWVTGGGNDGKFNSTSGDGFPTPTDEDVLVAASIATSTRSIGAALFQIPNAPIVFRADPVRAS